MDLPWFIAALFVSSFVGCLASAPKNVARGKPADQSFGPNVGSLTPDHAVDGDLSSDTSKLANTNNEFGSNWWRVDLGEQYKIGKVIIFGGTDQNRDMSKVYILTSNKSSPPPPSPNDMDWEIIYYGEPLLSEREEITLYLATSYQHLGLYREVGDIITREVEVYNWTGDDPQTQTLSQTAEQSSVFYGANASLAVDGRTDMRGAWGTYSGTFSAQTHWWRVSLKESCTNCYVRLYPYLRPMKFGFGNFSRLLVITVLSSTSMSPTAPTLSSSQWNTCYNLMEPQNGPIIGRCDGQNIRHVAVFKNTQQPLELVEVEVFHSVEDAFSSTCLTAANSSCVKMTWSVKSNHFIAYFKFNCTNKAARNFSATVKEYTQCGYLPYEEVTCKIEVIGFGSKAVEKTTRTLCEAPAKPTGIVVTQENQTSTELPKNRIKFTIRWTESKHNCAGVEYSVKLEGASPVTTVNSTNTPAIFENRIAGVEYTVTITAINKPNNIKSAPYTHTFTAKSRAPEFGNSRATVTATSPDCVKLDWEIPEHDNGAVTKYRHNCNAGGWTEVDSIIKSNNSICGFGPYKQVTCDVQAKNYANVWSLSISDSATTFCASPAKPTGIIVTQENQTSTELPRNRIKFTIRWTESKPNSAGLEYSVKLEGASLGTKTADSMDTQAIFENRIAGAEYTVTVTAKNKLDNQTSVSDPHTFTANSRAPEFGNRGAVVTATASDCVKLDWETPEYENGAVTKYKYKCNSRVWKEVDSNVKSNNICGFGAYKRVTCEVQAKNNADRWSSSISDSTTTLCADETVKVYLERNQTSSKEIKIRELGATLTLGAGDHKIKLNSGCLKIFRVYGPVEVVCPQDYNVTLSDNSNKINITIPKPRVDETRLSCIDCPDSVQLFDEGFYNLTFDYLDKYFNETTSCSYMMTVIKPDTTPVCTNETVKVHLERNQTISKEITIKELGAKLTLGVGVVKIKLNSGCFKIFRVYEWTEMKRAVQLRTGYQIKCTSLNKLAFMTIDAILKHSTNFLKALCPECQINGKKPVIQCVNETLTVIWKTDITSNRQWSMENEKERTTLQSSLIKFQKIYPEVDITAFVNLVPRTISPIKDKSGLYIKVITTAECSDNNFLYDREADVCVRTRCSSSD